jgi:hypothetical protein
MQKKKELHKEKILIFGTNFILLLRTKLDRYVSACLH